MRVASGLGSQLSQHGVSESPPGHFETFLSKGLTAGLSRTYHDLQELYLVQRVLEAKEKRTAIQISHVWRPSPGMGVGVQAAVATPNGARDGLGKRQWWVRQ